MKALGIGLFAFFVIIFIVAFNNKQAKEESSKRELRAQQQTSESLPDNSHQEEEFKKDEAEFKKLKSKFKIQEDKFEKVKFIKHRTNLDPLGYYLGHRKGDTWGRFKIKYEGNYWIFFDEIRIKGSRREDIKVNKFEIEKESAGNSVSESIDLDEEKMPMYIFQNSDSLSIRLIGKNKQDYNLNKKQIEAIKETMRLKSLLKKHPFRLKL